MKNTKNTRSKVGNKDNGSGSKCPFQCYVCSHILGSEFIHSRYELAFILFEKDPLIFDPMSELYTDFGKMELK
jgi:hypothetical protein